VGAASRKKGEQAEDVSPRLFQEYLLKFWGGTLALVEWGGRMVRGAFSRHQPGAAVWRLLLLKPQNLTCGKNVTWGRATVFP